MPDITSNYHGGNLNSIEARESLNGQTLRIRARVVEHVRGCGALGATNDEAQEALQLDHQTCSPRFTEAKARGEIVDSGERRRTRKGRFATVFVTPENAS